MNAIKVNQMKVEISINNYLSSNCLNWLMNSR